MNTRSLWLLGSMSLVLSCQSQPSGPKAPPQLQPQVQREQVLTLTPPSTPAQPVVPRVSYSPKSIPFGELKPLGNQKLAFDITFPDIQKGSQGERLNGFRTQAFSCGEVAYARIEVNGPGLASPIYADGSDGQNMINATGCNTSGTLSNIPYGKLVVSLQLFNADREPLSGASLTTGVNLNSSTQSLEMSFRQLNVGQVLETLLSGSVEDEFLSNAVDLSALQSFFDTVTDVGGSFPGYTFGTHPALINISQVIEDLKANAGNVSALNPANPDYTLSAGQASFNLQGVLSGQSVTASVDDALSADATINSDGLVTLNNLPPGTWKLRLSGNGYIDQEVSVTVTSGQNTDLGTLTILAPAPTLTTSSPTSGVSGQEITLSGTHFNSTAASNNTVRFGNTTATVSAATATSLTVTVPNGLTVGTQAITVSIGAGDPSNSIDFEVVEPTLTEVDPTATTIGQSIELTGTNFSPTLSDNTVTIGGQTATVTDASSTSLTVTVPSGIFGSVNVQVRNRQSPLSNTQTFEVTPEITSLSAATGSTGDSITLNGTGFDPTLVNNIVRLGSTNAVVTDASTTQLTVTVAEAEAGAANATVQVGNQTSAAESFTRVPRLTALDTGKTFNTNPALIREETLTLTGTNFDTTAANNIVSFGGITAPALTATATELTVTIPGTLGTPGDINISVSSNSQTSNTLVGTVPNISLNFTGGFQ